MYGLCKNYVLEKRGFYPISTDFYTGACPHLKENENLLHSKEGFSTGKTVENPVVF